jgi:hypothetical protein
MVPQKLQRFFWDTKCIDLDVQKNAPYVIERLLEVGDSDAVVWLLQLYPDSLITRVLKQTRSLSPRSANFWAIYFHLNPAEVPCIQKSWPQKLQVAWKN